MAFEIKEYTGQTKVTDTESDYSLLITPNMPNPFEIVKFQLPYRGRTEKGKVFNSYLDITGRERDEYDFSLRDLKMNPNFQYIEVGAGLGGMIQYILDTLSANLLQKPVIIDPANYELMKNILNYAKENVFFSNYSDWVSDEIKSIFDKYIKRCTLYQDHSKVRLINMKLGEALDTHSDLIGVGDVVINNAFIEYYPWTESDPFESDIDHDANNHIQNLISQLVKEGGVLLSS